MSERNYYVLCDSNCKFPAMTKEQILAAIAEATGNTPTCVNDAFISKIKEQNRGDACTVWIGTQAEYNALSEIVVGCLYFISDETTIADINRALVAMGAKVDDAVEAMTKANAQTLEAVDEKNTKTLEAVDEKIDDATTEINTVAVAEMTTFTAMGVKSSGGTLASIECAGAITFRKQGHIVTANIDITTNQQYSEIYLLASRNEFPDGFIPAAAQSGLLFCKADHAQHIVSLATIDADGLDIVTTAEATAGDDQCNWVGVITYFV